MSFPATEPVKNPLPPLFILSFQKNPSRFHILLIRSITLIYGESKEFTDSKHLSPQITVIQQIAMKLHRKKFCFTRNSSVKAKHDTQVSRLKAFFLQLGKKFFPIGKK